MNLKQIVVEEGGLSHKLRKDNVLIGVKADKLSSRTIKYEVDFLELKSAKYIKRSLVNMCKHNKIYIKISLDQYKTDPMLFCTLLKKLNIFRAWRLVVLEDTFLHSTQRVSNILEGFGFSKRNANRIVKNEEDMRKSAIIKKYAYNNTFMITKQLPFDYDEMFL